MFSDAFTFFSMLIPDSFFCIFLFSLIPNFYDTFFSFFKRAHIITIKKFLLTQERERRKMVVTFIFLAFLRSLKTQRNPQKGYLSLKFSLIQQQNYFGFFLAKSSVVVGRRHHKNIKIDHWTIIIGRPEPLTKSYESNGIKNPQQTPPHHVRVNRNDQKRVSGERVFVSSRFEGFKPAGRLQS